MSETITETGTALATTAASPAPRGITAFAFGDPEPVLDRSTLMGMMFAWQNGKWYEPPISLRGLARSLLLNTHHGSAIALKVNLLTKHFEPSSVLGKGDFRKFAKDFIVTGNAYFEAVLNRFGDPISLKHSPTLYTRRGVEEGRFFFVADYKQEVEFQRGSVVHLLENDLEQEIYGIPQWFAALQPAILNERATLFRRRYYDNGAHAGFILYLNEATVSDEDADAIRQAMLDAKGPGNFRNLFLHAPGGKEKGVQVIPISEIAAKDEFMGIKETTRDDVLAAHRTPPQLIGVVPKNNGGFGDAGTAEAVFFRNEIESIQEQMLEVNEKLGFEAIRFRPYVPFGKGAVA